ncbi:MoaD/ThiS family protein [Pseudomonas typographi]|uniref:Molybdopterin synthase sulfur carrier subunit n=1 Tax=Pseudomonas typographi TaxID=2715964 RepID=A0ABR7YYR9_9PSED|nr:MoaD/ThiS family protein [Pseudomonas typographi]MBD1550801.1 MoaD/ThiS family protein [Pseudomonas typographi]MBD1587743.1 MoaD/ThiS family protein [Pseudomonas typographi]MBD1598266.1 MoaD/ThiS family protein [Pseudomonas typographi]
MKLTVLYFARFREAMGKERETLEGPFTTLGSVRQHLLAQGGHDVLAERNVMCARNEELCSLNEPVEPGDEVAFFPTVTGG